MIYFNPTSFLAIFLIIFSMAKYLNVSQSDLLLGLFSSLVAFLSVFRNWFNYRREGYIFENGKTIMFHYPREVHRIIDSKKYLFSQYSEVSLGLKFANYSSGKIFLCLNDSNLIESISKNLDKLDRFKPTLKGDNGILFDIEYNIKNIDKLFYCLRKLGTSLED